ncbi:MAG: ligase-associated DNA damage response DEXH box helicase [Beijerinckiaceae bacterium]|nr:ligase-associated DNA damage response DEXH box helicase [Beijerinckiaceae bacterium]
MIRGSDSTPYTLPDIFQSWFAARGWQPRAHQLELLHNVSHGRSTLLVAPTGAGKTLAGFLPTLVDLSSLTPSALKKRGLHTLYISPLKALAVDIARNLETPVSEMDLPFTIETRTGDTPAHKRARQAERPPHILLTTPEQLALLLAHRHASKLFANLKAIILDELHALVTSKRGDLLALDLARLHRLSPSLVTIGLSATVREPIELQRYLVPQVKDQVRQAELVCVTGGAQAKIGILKSTKRLPLAGHTALSSMSEIYKTITAHHMTLVFVNTRMQAEFVFQELWKRNESSLPIALHHGSLDVGQRRKVEAAMVSGTLRAIVCTATLDLGIDWGDVDLVINVGAPKGASRLMQRIGRSNHRFDEPSQALLVPANRFEALECQAALGAVEAAAQDTPDARIGALDVLAQHILGIACADGFDPDALYQEICTASPYSTLSREDFDRTLDFAATGGYSLRAYEHFAKIKQGGDGIWRISTPRAAQQYRMNIGTIVESTMLKVRLGRMTKAGTPAHGGRVLGEVEDYFAEGLVLSDTFIFAGEILRFEGLIGNEVIVTRAAKGVDPKIPAYAGGKFPLSTFLAERVRAMLDDEKSWKVLPPEVREWLLWQKDKSVLPHKGELLVECFPSGDRHYLALYPFEGRLAHQTLGVLLTKRLERARMRPLGFVCNDYGICIWALRDLNEAMQNNLLSLDDLLDEDMLGDDLEEWLSDSSIMKRAFRYCAVISGLIERRHPGQEKSGRQLTVSTDLVYDVLRRHEPDHILLKAARADASSGLLDLKRLGDMLKRIRGHVVFKALEKVSPLSVAVLLEIGRESVYGEAAEDILADAERSLLAEAIG